jgi:hypothetical protein
MPPFPSGFAAHEMLDGKLQGNNHLGDLGTERRITLN